MNRRMIAYVLGRILLAEAGLMLPSLAVGIIYREAAARAFLIPMLLLAVFGVLLGIKKPRNTVIYGRDGFFIVAAAWVLMSVMGALPFLLSGEFASFWDCLFEIVSGFTTTGASVLARPEDLSYCLLFWRSFSHWVGGMGVLVFVLAIMPLSEDRSLHLMRAEVPGPVVGKLVPRMKQTAGILYAVYGTMTAVLVILLVAGGMPVFDALCNAFGTAGTGGFSVNGAGIAYYNSPYIELVIAVAMLLFGVNFNLYYLILVKRAREALKSEELRVYLCIAAAATALIAWNTFSLYRNVGTSLRHAFFQASSIMTTTGFSTVDFAADWPGLSQHTLLFLMVVGACAGSTGGGLKVSRLVLLVKTFGQEIRSMLHPRAVTVVRLEGRPAPAALKQSTLVYLATYVLIVIASTLLLSVDEFDLTTTFSAELACFNNIGPGLGLVGPMGTYAAFSPFSKVLLSFNMLLGRLEIFPMLILFSPDLYRRKTA